jgi:peroxiredoxin
LRSFQKALPEFEKRNVRVITISVDPPETSRRHAEKQGFTFPILADEKLEVIRRYGLLHAGGFRGADIARPGEFLLDSEGAVLWRDLTEDYRQRVKPEDVLKVIDQHKAGKDSD